MTAITMLVVILMVKTVALCHLQTSFVVNVSAIHLIYLIPHMFQVKITGHVFFQMELVDFGPSNSSSKSQCQFKNISL